MSLNVKKKWLDGIFEEEKIILCSRYLSCSNPLCTYQHIFLNVEERIRKNPNKNIPHLRSAFERDLLIKAVMNGGDRVIVR
jgi:hypothetical protein